jgi:hypothetical protein
LSQSCLSWRYDWCLLPFMCIQIWWGRWDVTRMPFTMIPTSIKSVKNPSFSAFMTPVSINFWNVFASLSASQFSCPADQDPHMAAYHLGVLSPTGVDGVASTPSFGPLSPSLYPHHHCSIVIGNVCVAFYSLSILRHDCPQLSHTCSLIWCCGTSWNEKEIH